VGRRGNGVPTPFCTTVTLLEDLDFSFQFLRVAECENDLLRVRASEQYLVLSSVLNQGCSGVGTAFPHLFFIATPLVLPHFVWGIQKRIFIFVALGYFKLGALLEGRDGRSHIFRLRIRSCSKIF